MALPKKKSRLIDIDGTPFRWMLGPNDGYNVFVAEQENIKGQKIQVYTEIYNINSDSAFNIRDQSNLKIIKPKDAESIIRQALNNTWNPEKKGSLLVFDLVDDKIVPRKTK